jgi:flagellar basal body-associated protein FliL
VTASVLASGSSTIALLGVLIPVVVVLLISAVPVYFAMSGRRRQRQGAQQIQQQRSQRDLAAEVEQMRRERAGE